MAKSQIGMKPDLHLALMQELYPYQLNGYCSVTDPILWTSMEWVSETSFPTWIEEHLLTPWIDVYVAILSTWMDGSTYIHTAQSLLLFPHAPSLNFSKWKQNHNNESYVLQYLLELGY